jgi:deazaflavin-dependent oxidoreductase (nitroreductase family)
MPAAVARTIAHFNKHVTNRITGPLAPYLPGFGVVHHTGRSSGRAYATPVNVFRAEERFVIALTYGTQADWVRNVLAAGGCELVTRGTRYRLVDPEITHDEARQAATWFARPVLRLVGAADFMRLRYAASVPAS